MTSPQPPLTRRGFLMLAGGATVGTALLGACSPHHKTVPTNSSTTSTTAGTSTTSGATTTTERIGTDADLSILRTLTSIEFTLVMAYDALAAYNVLQTDAFAIARLFRDHHRHHGTSLQDLTVKAGGSPVGSANQYLMTTELGPALEQLRGGPSAAGVRLAAKLERMLAATYVASAGTLSRPELRRAVMMPGTVESRHAVLWASQLSTNAPDWANDAVIPAEGHPGQGDGAVGADAYLSAS